jgi:propanol-preferring alcohol dehydrogenase
MRAMVFDGVGQPLRSEERPIPQPGPGQLLLRVQACGVCRTDLHLLDGEVEISSPPRILGHQIVAAVVAGGEGTSVEQGTGAGEEQGARRVGVPWLGWTDGDCEYCTSGRENLCPNARFTGRDIDGGYAEYTVADERYCFPIAAQHTSEQSAPLLCAGLIGYRALRMCGEAPRIGLFCRWQGRQVFAFTRPDDEKTQKFALELGAVWAGGSEDTPPEQLDAAIVFAPDGTLVPLALRALAPGGTVVCAGIHMSDIPAFPYSILWEERAVRSVANLTRRDGEELLALASRAGVRSHITTYPLEQAARALEDLRAGRFTGTAVLVP